MIMIIMMILYMMMMMMVFRYGDLAVGAPYSGVDGVGAVFVFRGGSSGVREQPDQVSSKSSPSPSQSSKSSSSKSSS